MRIVLIQDRIKDKGGSRKEFDLTPSNELTAMQHVKSRKGLKKGCHAWTPKAIQVACKVLKELLLMTEMMAKRIILASCTSLAAAQPLCGVTFVLPNKTKPPSVQGWIQIYLITK